MDRRRRARRLRARPCPGGRGSRRCGRGHRSAQRPAHLRGPGAARTAPRPGSRGPDPHPGHGRTPAARSRAARGGRPGRARRIRGRRRRGAGPARGPRPDRIGRVGEPRVQRRAPAADARGEPHPCRRDGGAVRRGCLDDPTVGPHGGPGLPGRPERGGGATCPTRRLAGRCRVWPDGPGGQLPGHHAGGAGGFPGPPTHRGLLGPKRRPLVVLPPPGPCALGAGARARSERPGSPPGHRQDDVVTGGGASARPADPSPTRIRVRVRRQAPQAATRQAEPAAPEPSYGASPAYAGYGHGGAPVYAAPMVYVVPPPYVVRRPFFGPRVVVGPYHPRAYRGWGYYGRAWRGRY
jgi:hypothetical protein